MALADDVALLDYEAVGAPPWGSCDANAPTLRPRRTGGGPASHSAEFATQLATATLGISSVTLAYRKQLLKPGAGIKAVTE